LLACRGKGANPDLLKSRSRRRTQTVFESSGSCCEGKTSSNPRMNPSGGVTSWTKYGFKKSQDVSLKGGRWRPRRPPCATPGFFDKRKKNKGSVPNKRPLSLESFRRRCTSRKEETPAFKNGQRAEKGHNSGLKIGKSQKNRQKEKDHELSFPQTADSNRKGVAQSAVGKGVSTPWKERSAGEKSRWRIKKSSGGRKSQDGGWPRKKRQKEKPCG